MRRFIKQRNLVFRRRFNEALSNGELFIKSDDAYEILNKLDEIEKKIKDVAKDIKSLRGFVRGIETENDIGNIIHYRVNELLSDVMLLLDENSRYSICEFIKFMEELLDAKDEKEASNR